MALILIVDDALLTRTVIRKSLRANGYQTIEAQNGSEALEKIRQQQPDCILLDLLIPEPNGFEVLKILQADDCQIPAIVITADTQETARTRCLALGAKAVIYKPPKPGELQAEINKVISIQSQSNP